MWPECARGHQLSALCEGTPAQHLPDMFLGGLGYPCSSSRRETQNSASLGAEESGTVCLGSEQPGSPRDGGTDWPLSDLRRVLSLGAPGPSSGVWHRYRVCLMGGVEDVAVRAG